ncbi:hypothetical protein T265_15176, partial [Opisthorchis viverrini]
MLYKRPQARKKYPLNCALMMSPRMVTKRLQANCQARRTDQRPPEQQPIMRWLLICSPSLAIDLQTFRHHSRRHLQCAVGWVLLP